ncbi:MAG: hypothetical protein V1859_08240 [archaeon]
MNKKAYFFIMDAAVAALILVIGYMLISTTSISKPAQFYNKHVADDLMNVLSNTKVNDLCGLPCTNSGLQNIFDNNNVKNTNNTLLELFGELYYRNSDIVYSGTQARSYIGTLANSLITDNGLFYRELYGTALFIEGTLVYYYNPVDGTFGSAPAQTIDNMKTVVKYNKIKNILSSKKIIMGYYEDETNGDLTFWGPFTVELWVWQKP